MSVMFPKIEKYLYLRYDIIGIQRKVSRRAELPDTF